MTRAATRASTHSTTDGVELCRTVADTLAGLTYETWGFGDSVAFEAMLVASEYLRDEKYRAFAHGWARSWACRAQPYRRLDCTAPGFALVQLARRAGDTVLMDALTGLAGYLRGRPALYGVYATWERSPLMAPYGPADLDDRGAALLANPPAGVFLDCLHFDPPFLVALGVATGRPELWRDGLQQALGYIRLLQTDGGLFDHFVLAGQPGTFGPGWGRGQGWALLGLLDVLDEMRTLPTDLFTDVDAAAMAVIIASADRLVQAMVALQRPDGHWSAVVDDRQSGEEYSTAAFMATGFTQAVRLGVATDERVGAAAAAALAATRAGLDRGGRLGQVSAAVMACTEPSHYAHVPRGHLVPWGQGPAVLALASGAA